MSWAKGHRQARAVPSKIAPILLRPPHQPPRIVDRNCVSCADHRWQGAALYTPTLSYLSYSAANDNVDGISTPANLVHDLSMGPVHDVGAVDQKQTVARL